MRSRRVLQADLYRSILVAADRAAKNTIRYADTMGETAYTTLWEENFKQRVFQMHYAKEKISNTSEAATGIAAINRYINLRN